MCLRAVGTLSSGDRSPAARRAGGGSGESYAAMQSIMEMNMPFFEEFSRSLRTIRRTVPDMQGKERPSGHFQREETSLLLIISCSKRRWLWKQIPRSLFRRPHQCYRSFLRRLHTSVRGRQKSLSCNYSSVP